jgi:WD40 repeat protein
MVVSEQNKLLIAGTEDNLLRLIDLNSNKVVKTIVAHTDSVTSLMIHHRKNQ